MNKFKSSTSLSKLKKVLRQNKIWHYCQVHQKFTSTFFQVSNEKQKFFNLHFFLKEEWKFILLFFPKRKKDLAIILFVYLNFFFLRERNFVYILIIQIIGMNFNFFLMQMFFKYIFYFLSEEERKIAEKEMMKFPSHGPLSSLQEKNLKTIRRKLRNKTSAQRSRQRKKEHLDKIEEQNLGLNNT